MKPNLVIILIDGLSIKNLSLFGYHQEIDANIKKLASESINFTNHFSAANFTYPSLTSLFTGKYPIDHGLIHTMPWTPPVEIENLKKNKFWLPSYLRDKGYETVFISLMGLWLKTGFNYTQQPKQKDAYKKITTKKFVKKLINLLPDWAYILLKKILRRDISKDFPFGREAVDLAIFKINEIKKTKKPFFMFLHIEDAHYPWGSSKTPQIKGENTLRKVLKKIPTASQKAYVKRGMISVKANSLEQLEARYKEGIKEADKQVGRFYSFLEESNLLKNTIVILLSDHGFVIGKNGIYNNQAGLYDDSIHTPLLFKLPKLKPQKISSLVQNIDIAPTILDLLGEKNKEIDGKSLIPLIKSKKEIRDRIFSFDGSAGDRWCVRDKNAKMIFAKNRKCNCCKAEHGKEVEIYNLKEDPEEKINLAKEEDKYKEFNEKINIENI